jgi:hypothetical protein
MNTGKPNSQRSGSKSGNLIGKSGSVEILFSNDSLILIDLLEGDPLSPQRGRQSRGAIALTPHILRVSTEPKIAKSRYNPSRKKPECLPTRGRLSG